jgi:pyrroline-5-carboxylate reductase
MVGSDLRIGFLGAGKMATALARGWLGAGLASPSQLLASDLLPQAREAFSTATGSRTVSDNRQVLKESNLIVLAVKPQSLAALFAEIRPGVTSQHLLISLAAGFSLQRLEEGLGPGTRLVRVMPNTPCLVGAGTCAYSGAKGASAEDLALVDRLLQAVGRAFLVPENLLDAVTGLSGSGPAFVFVMIEALSDGGVRVGLSREVATALAAQTVLGAARMVLETGLHTGVLKDMVASPGGTTIAGLYALEKGGLRGVLMDAVEAATRRANELGK